jgi:hypothetical protein
MAAAMAVATEVDTVTAMAVDTVAAMEVDTVAATEVDTVTATGMAMVEVTATAAITARATAGDMVDMDIVSDITHSYTHHRRSITLHLRYITRPQPFTRRRSTDEWMKHSMHVLEEYPGVTSSVRRTKA